MNSVFIVKDQFKRKVLESIICDINKLNDLEIEGIYRSSMRGFLEIKDQKDWDMFVFWIDYDGSDGDLCSLSEIIEYAKSKKTVLILNEKFKSDERLVRISENENIEIVFEKEMSIENLKKAIVSTRNKYEKMQYCDVTTKISLTEENRESYIKEFLNRSNSKNEEDVQYLMQGMPADIKKTIEKKTLGEDEKSEEKNKKNGEEKTRFCKNKNMNSSKERLKICVWNNSEFASELSWVLAKDYNLKTLIIDADRLNPTLDLTLGVEKYKKSIRTKENSLDNSGLNIVVDCIRKNIINKEIFYEACEIHKDCKNLHCITGSYNLKNYEYFDIETFLKLIEKSGEYFDVVIIVVNKFIYDKFTAMSLIVSDVICIPVKPTIASIREYTNYIEFLCEKQNMNREKAKFVAFDYENTDFSIEDLKDFTNGYFLGKVPMDKNRTNCRLKRKSYVKIMNKKVSNSYSEIIEKLF